MMAGFNNASVEVEVYDSLICCCVAQENASEVVMIQLSPMLTTPMDADMEAKDLNPRQIRFCTIVSHK